MAEAAGTGTELAMSGMGLDSYDNDAIPEQKSGFMDSIGGADTMRQVVLPLLSLFLCGRVNLITVPWLKCKLKS